MNTLTQIELSENEMQDISGGGIILPIGFSIPITVRGPNLRFNYNANFGFIIVAGNTINAPLTINLNQSS